MYQEFDVGDSVTIVDEPYYGPPDLWVSAMTDYCSVETTIVDKEWDDADGRFYYEIAADAGLFTWCAGCFRQADTPDFEIASEEEMLNMLGVKMR